MLQSKNGGSAKGLEYLQNVNHYQTTNDLGQTVVNHGPRLTNDDGTLHAAYANGMIDYIIELLEKQKKGFPLTEYELNVLKEYYATNPTQGLATIDQLGGNHNGGISSQPQAQQITRNANGTYSVQGRPGWYTKANFS